MNVTRMLFMVLSKVHYYMPLNLCVIYTIITGVGGAGYVYCILCVCLLWKILTMSFIIKLACRDIIFLMMSSQGLLPTPGEAKAKAMPGRLYIHTKIIIK